MMYRRHVTFASHCLAGWLVPPSFGISLTLVSKLDPPQSSIDGMFEMRLSKKNASPIPAYECDFLHALPAAFERSQSEHPEQNCIHLCEIKLRQATGATQ